MHSQSLTTLLLAAGYALAVPTHVLNTDFPDPAVIQTDQGYYAFGTQGNGVHVQVARSDDFTTWSLLDGTDALPGPFPAWVNQDDPQFWAPDVIQRVRPLPIYQSETETGMKHDTGDETNCA